MDKNNIRKEYTNGDITVVWQSGLCIHSKKCWNGLPQVFNPKERPWINMEGATSEAIKTQVDNCPSGALSWYKNGEEQKMSEAKTKVEVTKNGPLLVYGAITLVDKHGTEHEKTKVTALCRCGESANKPYCDGTHNTCGFKDE